MMKTRPQATIEEDWDLFDRILTWEEEWERSSPRYTDKELLTIFPEAKMVIDEKMREWEQQRNTLLDTIKTKLRYANQIFSDEFSYWFMRYWLQLTEGKKLMNAERHIARLKRLSAITQGKQLKGQLSEEQIQQALTVPIESLIGTPLRKSGKTLVGICPLHSEKHASFCIYPATNSCWCFGCQQGGDSISFVKLLHGCSFREAVQYLLRF